MPELRINRLQEGGERNEGMSGVRRYGYKTEERKERSSYKENYERTRKSRKGEEEVIFCI